MKVEKQLSERQFVVSMDDEDLKMEDAIIVAHDYVSFSANHGYMVSSDFQGIPNGKFAGAASNWIKGRHTVQIDIRDMVDVVLPMLTKHEYCQPQHLLSSDGKPAYTFSHSSLIFYENGVKKIAVKKMGSDKYAIMDYDTYCAIKNGEL